MQRRRVGFARWRSDVASGGNRYDDELAAGLRALGLDLCEYAVPGSWPAPEHQDRQQFTALLSTEPSWLINNILGSAAPDAIRATVTAGHQVTMLIHYFPADDPTLSSSERERLAAAEAEAIAAANTIVVTSAWAAGEVASRYGRADAVVAVPGVEPAEVALGSLGRGQPPLLLWLARLTRTKDPLTFVEALTRLQDLDWTAQLVGPDTLDESLTRELRAHIAETGLTGRVEVLGSREGDSLESVWANTDLLVHTARAENYGMVVTEALARGIPSIVPSGTGAVEAQGVGATFPPGDATALAGVLREWLTDPQLRDSWRTEAAEVRAHLPTWRTTAEIVWSAITG